MDVTKMESRVGWRCGREVGVEKKSFSRVMMTLILWRRSDAVPRASRGNLFRIESAPRAFVETAVACIEHDRGHFAVRRIICAAAAARFFAISFGDDKFVVLRETGSRTIATPSRCFAAIERTVVGSGRIDPLFAVNQIPQRPKNSRVIAFVVARSALDDLQSALAGRSGFTAAGCAARVASMIFWLVVSRERQHETHEIARTI